MEPSPIRVVVVEDLAMVAEGLARILSAEADVEVVGIAPDAADGFRLATEAAVDVAVVDQALPDALGTELAERLRAAGSPVRVVLVSPGDELRLARAAIDAGCAGLLSKARRPDELLRAVRAATRGEMYFSADALRLVMTPPSPDQANRPVGLTPRELSVLHCLAEGMSNAAIARALYLSPNTVANHLQRLTGKLDAHSKLEALVKGLRLGIVDLPLSA